MEWVINGLLHDENEIGMAILDPDNKVLFANPKIKSLFAFEQGHILPAELNVSQLINKSIEQNRRLTGIPLHEDKIDHVQSTLLYTMPSGGDESHSSLLLIAIDITKLNEVYASTLQHERMKVIGDMAAETANIILNPVAVIKGTLQLIQKVVHKEGFMTGLTNHPSYSKLNQYFALSYDQLQHVDNVLRRFLLLGKPSEISFTPLTVISFLRQLIPDIQEVALSHQLYFICEYPNINGSVLADSYYLKEALTPIFQNAFEASQRGTNVKLRTYIEVETVEFIISDEGEGISAENIAHVKAPFFTTKENALGFGLCYAEGIIHKMGGSIQIQSTQDGTEVRVTLPRLQ